MLIGLQQNGTQLQSNTLSKANGQRLPPPPLPPPPIKYPIEDLDLPPRRGEAGRPKLEFWTPQSVTRADERKTEEYGGIEPASMGMLLEVWNTLNVHCEVYLLDSFTFDDFVDAMKYRSLETPCELLEETFCAVLKSFVDESGNSTLSKNALPEMVPSGDEDSDDSGDTSKRSTPAVDVPARSTRSRLSHVDTVAENPRTPVIERLHRAPELTGDRDWFARLTAREMTDGGWQVILAALLHQLSLSPVFKSRCNKVLAWLVPLEQEPTAEVVRARFVNMDVNLRISALEVITILSMSTSTIRNYLDTCSDDMTCLRKNRAEEQRERKIAVEELHAKERERKLLLSDNPELGAQTGSLSVDPAYVNGDNEESIEVSGANVSDADDGASDGRALRRGNDRKRKRDEQAAVAAEEKIKKTEQAKKQNKQAKAFKKLIGECEALKGRIMQYERSMADIDADLREANTQRTKVLGKDRYCNRYYWFERNGMPFGGLPESSTAHYGYANARIWVQGPDELERVPLIERAKEDQDAYKRQFGVSVLTRRRLEEGGTSLPTANDWGYYDNAVALSRLIDWLDDKGERERALKRELIVWQDTITEYMLALRKFQDDEAAKKAEADDEASTRIATRHKTHEGQSAAKQRCLKWHNGLMEAQHGCTHAQPSLPRAKRQQKKSSVKPQKGIALVTSR